MFGSLVAWETGLVLDNTSSEEDTQVNYNFLKEPKRREHTSPIK